MKRAHEIERLIDERAGTRDLDDSDFDNPDDDNESHVSISSNESDEPVPIPKPKTAIARAVRNDTPAPRRNARGGNGLDLLGNISQAFDPEAQRSRDAERANRSLQNTQFLTLSQQLRDAQHATESVRNQLADVQSRLQDAERARDRAEFRLEMLQMSGAKSVNHSRRGNHSARHRNSPKGKHRCEEVYLDGGGKVWWVTDEEDIDSEASRDWDGYRRPPRPRKSRSPRVSRSALSTVHRQQPLPSPDPYHNNTRCQYTPSPHHIPRAPSPFRSAMRGRNNTAVHAPALDLTETNLATRGSGPQSLNIEGDAVELTVSPHRGAAVSFVITPVKSSAKASSSVVLNDS